MEWLADPQIWIGLVTLTALEIVLGIDNIIFISILAGRLPVEQQDKARIGGLALAVVMRVLLLLSISTIVKLTAPLFTVFGEALSGRDLILLGGGLFLLAKSVHEIHSNLVGHEETASDERTPVSFAAVLAQIALLDVVFSFDSVITAVGMVEQIGVMITAVIIAIGVMMLFAGKISRFVEQNPTIKILALSFLILIGVSLIAESLDHHIPKGYIYFSMAFALGVELLNLRIRKNAQPVELQGVRLPHAPN